MEGFLPCTGGLVGYSSRGGYGGTLVMWLMPADPGSVLRSSVNLVFFAYVIIYWGEKLPMWLLISYCHVHSSGQKPLGEVH